MAFNGRAECVSLAGVQNDQFMIDFKKIIFLACSHFPNMEALYIFGSCATGNHSPKSDVDIGLLLPVGEVKKKEALKVRNLKEELELTVRKNVDLIDLRQASTVLQKEVIFKGQRIFCKNQFEADLFEALVLSSYQKLNDERREIISEGLSSGGFYQI